MRLTVVARLLRADFDRRVSTLGITRSQFNMIAVVSRKPGATQREVAEILEMSEASAGRLIDRLCVDGLLERRARADDRRAREVYLTPAAEPLMQRIAELATAREQIVYQGLSDEELVALLATLDRICANISTPGASAHEKERRPRG